MFCVFCFILNTNVAQLNQADFVLCKFGVKQQRYWGKSPHDFIYPLLWVKYI